MDIDLLAKEAHQIAVDHGWWESHRPFPETVALCHSELSEALEAYRLDMPAFYVNYEGGHAKPDGIAVEMVDCVIRILDWFGAMNIDPSDIIEKKIEYNRGRPYRHGGKKI